MFACLTENCDYGMLYVSGHMTDGSGVYHGEYDHRKADRLGIIALTAGHFYFSGAWAASREPQHPFIDSLSKGGCHERFYSFD